MYNARKGWWAAVLLAVMMALPGIPADEEGARESPDIVFGVTTFSDGNASKELLFPGPGSDSSSGLTLPNGATVLDARLNISAAPLDSGGREYPRNVTVDVGNDGEVDWAFRGTGYGDMGHQYMFDTGENTSRQKSGPDNSSTSHFQLPAGADILDARCNVTSLGVVSKVTLTGGDSPVQSPFNIGQYRMQWLYNTSEVGRAGNLDKVGWRVYSGTGSGTLSNFKMFLGHTPLQNTSDTFDDNWGGETPVKVIDEDSYNYSDVDGWITIDFPGMFYYNHTMNLLIELSFSARMGTNYLLYFYYMPAGSGTRRLYNNVDYTDTTGILDNPDSPLHYDCRFEFAEGFCMTVDMCGDSVPDFVNDMWEWNATSIGFTQALRTFMETAEVNLTDGYDNRFVSVPIVVRTEAGGGVLISNLSVTYDYMAVVNEHPAYTGDLAEVLDNILPFTPDGKFTTIPVNVATTRPGRLRLSNLSIDYRPPLHDPDIDSALPAPGPVAMNENETLSFSIQASDEYGYPLSTAWYVDTLVVARDVQNITYFADFESSGNHTVSVDVDNTMRKRTLRWDITVQNVNRPPAVDSFYPEPEVTINEEESVNLGVVASDPDSQDRELRYAWYIGAIAQGVPGDSFRFDTDLSSAGVHSIRVKVSDEGGLSASQTWKVTVLNVNVPPVVDTLAPNFNPNIRETDAATFSISASDFDKQALTYRWYIDGEEAGSGQQYTYRSNYDSAGLHLVEVVISDGEANVTRSWTVTVENVNRMPVPVIDRPSGKMGFLETERVNFSAVSSSDPDGDPLRYRWFEGSRELSSSAEFEALFTRGTHEVTLEVSDPSRASNRTSVRFNVHYVKLVANLDLDVLEPVEGKKLTFTAWVNNTGDAEATDVEVELLVDGTSLGRQAVDSVPGGGTESVTFEWKALKGEHVMTIRIGGQSWNSTVVVARKPAPPPADLTWLYLVAAVVAVAAAAGGAFVAVSRRKKAGASAAEGGPEAKAPAEEPAPPAGPVAAPAARAKEGAGDVEKRDRARMLILSTEEKVADLLESPQEGIDVTSAMEDLDLAKTLLDDGDLDGALKLAEDAQAGLSAAVAAAAEEPGPAAKEPPTGPSECPSCGEPLETGWAVCPTCGEKL